MAKDNQTLVTDANEVEQISLHHALTSESATDLIRTIDAFLFDCDGVIWKGDKLIDGVSESLQVLRSLGKRLVFVTNNSTKSRRQYAKKFGALGLDVSEEEIFSSSFAAAMFLKLNDFPRDKKVYVIGEEGILEELKLAGYTGLGGPDDGMKTIQLKSNFLFEHDKNVGAVIVGLDQYINFYKLQYATLCIRENPDCLFIATNRDAVGHLTELQEWPGAGCMVAAVCGSVQKEPIVVGKPSTFLMNFLLERYQINTSKMCMVGDRLDTDILFGKNAGCKTLLVLSGVTTLSDLKDSSNSIYPDYYTKAVWPAGMVETNNVDRRRQTKRKLGYAIIVPMTLCVAGAIVSALKDSCTSSARRFVLLAAALLAAFSLTIALVDVIMFSFTNTQGARKASSALFISSGACAVISMLIGISRWMMI